MKRILGFMVVGLIMLAFGGNLAGEDASKDISKKILFYTSFDKGFDADIAGGLSKPAENYAQLFKDGKKGQGLLAMDKASIRYHLTDNIDLDKGTLTFWFKPMDWSGSTDHRARYFFVIYVSSWLDGMYTLFDNSGFEIAFAAYEHTGKQGNGFGAGKGVPPASVIYDGLWTHFACVWDNSKGLWLYVNGELKGESQVTWQSLKPAVTGGSTIMFGGSPWGAPVTVDGVMDEIYIYSEPLSAEQIKKLSIN